MTCKATGSRHRRRQVFSGPIHQVLVPGNKHVAVSPHQERPSKPDFYRCQRNAAARGANRPMNHANSHSGRTCSQDTAYRPAPGRTRPPDAPPLLPARRAEMSLAAGFGSPADRRAYAVVAAGAAGLSYYHAREFFLPFMGAAGAALTPLLLDAVVFWLASASIRQARAGRPLPMLRAGAYALLALTVTANALGGATPAQRVFLALPAGLFGFLVEARTRLALCAHRAGHGE